MLIKVCGMREPENIRNVSELDIDLMGFIFYPKSPRYVNMTTTPEAFSFDSHKNILDEKDEKISATDKRRSPKKVGVFVDESPQNIAEHVRNYGLDYIQLHGKESSDYIESIKSLLTPEIRIIKALSVQNVDDVKRWKDYFGKVDFFLFDTQCKTYGGSGAQFDWSVLNSYDGDIPFFLSGGIGPGDVERVLSFNHPMMIGVDLNSRFEISPALKDVDLLRSFIRKIKGESSLNDISLKENL